MSGLRKSLDWSRVESGNELGNELFKRKESRICILRYRGMRSVK